MPSRRLTQNLVLAATALAVACPLSTPTLAQEVQPGGGGSGGSASPVSPGAAGTAQPLGNGAHQTLGQATAKRPTDGALPFFAASVAPLDGSSLAVDTKGVTAKTDDNAVRFRIGARVQLDVGAGSLSPRTLGPALTDTFALRRSYFETYLTLHDAVEMAFQYDFSNDAQPIQDAVLAYRGMPHVIASLGNFKEPVGQDQLRSDNTTTFVERSLTNAFFPARNFGGAVAAYGDRWTATAGVFGNNANIGITDNGVAGAARFTYAPLLDRDQVLHLGVGGSYRALDPNVTAFSISSRPEDNESSRTLVSTGTLRNARDVSRVDVEAIYQFRSYRITGEYAFAAVGGVTPTATAANRSDRFFQSGYVEGAWVINGDGRPYRVAPTYGSEFAVLAGVEIDDAQRISRGGYGVFEVAARYSAIDLQDGVTLGGRQQDVTAGLNWYPDRNIRVMADYIHGVADPAAASLKVGKVDSDAFVGRLQFAW